MSPVASTPSSVTSSTPRCQAAPRETMRGARGMPRSRRPSLSSPIRSRGRPRGELEQRSADPPPWHRSSSTPVPLGFGALERAAGRSDRVRGVRPLALGAAHPASASAASCSALARSARSASTRSCALSDFSRAASSFFPSARLLAFRLGPHALRLADRPLGGLVGAAAARSSRGGGAGREPGRVPATACASASPSRSRGRPRPPTPRQDRRAACSSTIAAFTLFRRHPPWPCFNGVPAAAASSPARRASADTSCPAGAPDERVPRHPDRPAPRAVRGRARRPRRAVRHGRAGSPPTRRPWLAQLGDTPAEDAPDLGGAGVPGRGEARGREREQFGGDLVEAGIVVAHRSIVPAPGPVANDRWVSEPRRSPGGGPGSRDAVAPCGRRARTRVGGVLQLGEELGRHERSYL